MCFGEDALPGTFKSLQNTSSNQYFVGRLFPTTSTDVFFFFFLSHFLGKARVIQTLWLDQRWLDSEGTRSVLLSSLESDKTYLYNEFGNAEGFFRVA